MATFTWQAPGSGSVTFSAADAANVVIYYVVEIKDKTTGELVAIYDAQAKNYTTTLKPPANHIFYPDGERMPDTVTLALQLESSADPTHEYTLHVRGVDDFGVASSVCSFDFALE